MNFRPEPWMEEAACRNHPDPDAFFRELPRNPSLERHAEYRATIAICASCPVTANCLAYALEYRCEGIWAGTTEHERRLFERKRATRGA